MELAAAVLTVISVVAVPVEIAVHPLPERVVVHVGILRVRIVLVAAAVCAVPACAVFVVFAAFFLVAKNLVCGGNLLEFFLRALVVWIPVRMIFHGKFSVC